MAEIVPLDSIRPDPANVRLHPARNLDQIAASLARFGQQKPLVVDAHGIIRAGNGTWEAARALGWTTIEIRRTELEGPEAIAYAIADNRSTETSAWDPAGLDETLKALAAEGAGLDESWFSTDEIAALLASVTTVPPTYGDPDAVPETPVEPVGERGDLWLCGRHRVLCGDSTVVTDVGRLMGDQIADMLWSDPPYGVSYVGKTGAALTISNDGADGLASLLLAAFEAVTPYLKAGAGTYIAAPAGRLNLVFRHAFLEVGWTFHQGLVWVKDTMVLGHSDYHFQHEDILYGYTPGGDGRPGRGAHPGTHWHGDHSQTSVFHIDRPNRSEDHPTMKPVDLIAAMIPNSSAPGGLVVDPFLGSGTTLIAAEQLGRRCYGMEIEPRYVDVILDRYAAFAGTDPVHADTGRAWSATKGERGPVAA